MLQATFIGYVRIHSVSPIMAMGTTDRRDQPLFKVSAVAMATYGGSFTENTGFVNDDREVDLDFTDLTDKAARLIAAKSEIFINGGKPFSYNAKIGFPGAIVNKIMGRDESDNSSVYAADLIESLSKTLGVDQIENLKQIIPPIRRKTAIQVPSGTWRVTAHPNQLESGQNYSNQIETPV